ncbi:MAG: polysaccharide deacetylase family protein [Pirellulales bacterium]
MTYKLFASLTLFFLVLVCVHGSSARSADEKKPTSADANTEILKWKDGKAAVYLLAFDDACATHIKNVIPVLKQRRVPATFYVITNAGQFKDQKAWAVEAKSPYVILGNHTDKHNGAQTLDEFEKQVADANEVIKARTPHLPTVRLISYGKPGGVKWGESVTDEAMKPILARHDCVDRPPFWGAVLHVKTVEDMKKQVDNAIKKGEMAHLDFHGVDGDWLSTPMEFLTGTLDYLETKKDDLWVTDHATYAKYLAERKGATVKTLKQDDRAIQIALTATTDPKFYDQPLTLKTKTPSVWKRVQVKQGATTTVVEPKNGEVVYDALPGDTTIELTPAP